MSQYGNNKNTPPPWAQTPNMLQRPAAPQQLMAQPMLVQQTMQQPAQVQYGMPFQQQQGLGPVSLGAPGIALPTTLASSQVQYPARALGQSTQYPNQQMMQAGGQQQQPKQRVFTGTITKLHDNFGFVDEDVFFQTNCIRGTVPKVGERVLVEAQYNASMPFKWNATRIQLLPNQGGGSAAPAAAATNAGAQLGSMAGGGSSLTGLAAPPGMGPTSMGQQGNTTARSQAILTRGPPGLVSNNKAPGSYSAVPPPSDAMPQATPLFGGRMPHSGRPRSPIRRVRGSSREKDRRRSRDRDEVTPRRRSRSRSPRRRRTPRYNVHVPKVTLDLSDATMLTLKKRYNNLYVPSDFFLADFHCGKVFPLHRPFQLASPVSYHVMSKEVDPIQENDAIYEPDDVEYKYCAKVMLLTTPSWENMYRKTCSLAEDESSDDADLVHPSRVVSFLVGLRGKNETMAIGGPWSPSLDGADPEHDPQVLIRTAIRTCRALTGIDLSGVTKWYRLAEIFYRRGGRSTETVVLYLPDTGALMPPRVAWERTVAAYRQQLQTKLNPAAAAASADDKDEDGDDVPPKAEPTHWAELDPHSMKVAQLKQELELRTLSPKGLKSQLIARLTKVLKTEEEKEEEEKAAGGTTAVAVAPPPAPPAVAEKEDENSEDEETRRKEEAERRVLEKRYALPDSPHVLVHPHKTAKSGKFDCTVMSLSVLLDYRQEDNKEHSFEVSLFAEIFNEMLMRDAGFTIYRALMEAPEKTKDDKKHAKKDDDKSKDKEDDKDGGGDKDGDKDEDADEKKDGEDEADQNKYTADRPLLMAFSYFDTSHCGYIVDKDLEEVIHTIGVGVSRAQTRKLVGRVAEKDAVHYRLLTDRPVPEDGEPAPVALTTDAEQLARGNRRFLPAFAAAGDAATPPPPAAAGHGMVSFQGSMVDVAALLTRVAAADTTLQQTERRMEQIQEEARSAKEECASLREEQEQLTAQLNERRDHAEQLEMELTACRTTVGKYGTALDACYAAVAPLVAEAESRAQAEQEAENATKEKQQEEAKNESEEDNKPPAATAAENNSEDSKSNVKEETKTPSKRRGKDADSPVRKRTKTENGETA